MEFNKKVQIALGEMFKDVKLDKVTTPKKVELGAIDDFDTDFGKILDKDIKASSAFIDDLKKAENAAKVTKNELEKILKVGKQIEESAKDLGVELPQRIKNQILSAEITIKNKETLIKKIKSMYNIEF